MMTEQPCHHLRGMFVPISIFLMLSIQLVQGENRLLNENNGEGDIVGGYHLPSTKAAETGDPDSDSDDILPAWFAYSLALVLFFVSIFLYLILFYWGEKLESEKIDAALQASAATEKQKNTRWTDTRPQPVRSRRWSSFLSHPMSPAERWVVQQHAVIRNFIMSALVFFAIPNLVILGGLQNHFEATLFGLLMGIAGCLTIAIIIRILLTVHEETSDTAAASKIATSPYNTFVANNKYEHFHLPALDVIILGAGQITLLAMYTWGLYEAGPPMFNDSRQYMYYFLGILMQVAYGYDKKIWNNIQSHTDFWIGAIRADRLNLRIAYTNTDSTEERFDMKADKLCFFRFMLSTLINTCGLFLIMMGLPIQVATQRDPLDFVLNVVAAFYIVEWDDLGDLDHAQFTCLIDPYLTAKALESDCKDGGDTDENGYKHGCDVDEVAILSDTKKTHEDDESCDNNLIEAVLEDIGLGESSEREGPVVETYGGRYSMQNEHIERLHKQVRILKTKNQKKEEDMEELKANSRKKDEEMEELKYEFQSLKSQMEKITKQMKRMDSAIPFDEDKD